MSPKVLRNVGILVIFAFCLATYQWGKWYGYRAGYVAGGGDETRYMAGLSDTDRHVHVLDVLCAKVDVGAERQTCLAKLSEGDRKIAELELAQLAKLKP